MSDFAHAPMTSDEFIAWAMQQPDGARYELVGGEVVRMASERVEHGRVKFRVARLMADAVEKAGLACEVFTDGMAVQVDEHTTYEPDALIRCGDRLAGALTKLVDPLVVVEVVSPSTASVDAGAKLADYFRIPSLRQYLIVRTKDRTVIQHTRADDGGILTRIVRDGAVELDPPGIVLAGLFD